ncbi:g9855 [Coccomyxa elongata]
MFTPHELQPRSRQLGRIPFPSLTPFAGSTNASLERDLGTPLPIPLATPVVPRQSQAPRLPQPHFKVVNIGEFGTGSPKTGEQVSTGLQRSRLGNLTPNTPASPLLWPSRTPLDNAQRDTPKKSPSLASLPKPSVSLQDSRDRDRGKSGLLSNLHAQSTASRTLHPSQTPASPSLPKAARADPALVNFPISASRDSLWSQLDSAKESTEPAGFDDSALPTPVVLIQKSHSERMRSAAIELRPGARRKPASALLTSADASSPASAQHLQPPAAAGAARSRAGNLWVPMQPAHKRGLQPLGSGKLRVSSSAAPSGRAETEAQAEERPLASHSSEAAPLEPSSSIQQQAPADRHHTKGRGKERLAELHEMLRELGALILPQPLQPMAIEQRYFPAAFCGEGWAREQLAQLHSLQVQAADALAAREEEDQAAQTNGASGVGVSTAAQFEATWKAAVSLSAFTQPAQRLRQLEGLSSSTGSGRRGGPLAAHLDRVESQASCDRFWDESVCMGVVRKEAYAAVFLLILLQFLVVQSSEVEGLRVVSRPGRKLLQCTTEAACRARCPPGNNIIYLAPQDGTSGQCVCICSPTNSPQNSTPNTRSGGLIGSSLGGSGSFAQPLGGGGGGGGSSSAGNGGIGSQSSAGSTNPDSGSGDTSGGTGTVQSVGSGTVTSSASQQGSNLVGSVTSAGSSSDTTTATLVNSATGAGSRGTSTSSSRNPSQSG